MKRKTFVLTVVVVLLLSSISSLEAYDVCRTSGGAVIKWFTNNATFYVNTSGGPSGALTATQNAMQTWTNAPANFSFSYGGTTTSTAHGIYDLTNIIGFGSLPVGTVGQNAFWYYSNGQLIDSDIRLNTYYSWATNGAAGSFDVETVALHELGHSLCLSDLYSAADSAKVMYGYVSTGQLKRSLHLDDIDGIAFIYGPSGCTYFITPINANFSASGGVGSVAVTAGAGCEWTAVSNNAWITVTGGSSGSGNGTVTYSVSANTGGLRTGTVTIAGQTFTVTQEAR